MILSKVQSTVSENVRLLGFLFLGLTGSESVNALTCDHKKLSPELQAFAESFQNTEKVILGDSVPSSFKNNAAEFIFRAKARNWKDYSWKLQPLEMKGLLMAQEKYQVLCEAKARPLIQDVILFIENDKTPLAEKKKALRTLMLFSPCSSGEERALIKKFSFDEFKRQPESYVDLLIVTESESLAFVPQYRACVDSALNEKFPLAQFFLENASEFFQEARIDSKFAVKLKKLRQTKSQFKTAKYLLEQLDLAADENKRN